MNAVPENKSNATTISFCTTCRNRMWQLTQTLAFNLRQLGSNQNLVLVDYGSNDGLSNWVWSNFADEIRQQRLIFFEVTNPVSWSAPKAKNLAHRLTKANYLFNLDADNFITASDIVYIQKMADLGFPCQQYSGIDTDGSYGRIGLSRELFLQLGGYDESLLPMGAQDTDLLRRIFYLEASLKVFPGPTISAIQNSWDDKLKELTLTHSSAQESYDNLNKLNICISNFQQKLHGPKRLGGFSSYMGKLNGETITIDGFNNMYRQR
jgi:hypothetical protein